MVNKTFEQKTFNNSNIVLDDVSYIECTFNDCQFLYRGGLFFLQNNTFTGVVNILMDGAAANTMQLLQLLHAGGGGLTQVAESFIAGIRGDPLSAQTEFDESRKKYQK